MPGNGYVWDFSAFFRFLPFLLDGLKVTLSVSLLATGVGSAIGLLVALLRLSPIAVLRWIAAFYVDFLRSTPLLVQLIWVYFALPILLGFSLSPIVAGVMTLGAYSGAYLAEIFRAGILSIASGQRQAALALGMTPDSGPDSDHPAPGRRQNASAHRQHSHHPRQGFLPRFDHLRGGAACGQPSRSPRSP